MEQPIKPIARWWGDVDLVLATDCVNSIGPVNPSAGKEIGILLQSPAGRRRGPGNNDSIGGSREDGQPRRAQVFVDGHVVNEPAITAQGGGAGPPPP